MIYKKGLTYMHHLHADKFEAFRLKPLDDLSNDSPLHTIRLDGNEGALFLFSHDSVKEEKEMTTT